MNKYINLIFILFVSIFIFSCSGSLEKYKKDPCNKNNMPNGNVVTAIKENCVNCHKNDFNTKEDICSRKNLIIDAVSSGRMPKLGKLYDNYKKAILEWK